MYASKQTFLNTHTCLVVVVQEEVAVQAVVAVAVQAAVAVVVQVVVVAVAVQAVGHAVQADGILGVDRVMGVDTDAALGRTMDTTQIVTHFMGGAM